MKDVKMVVFDLNRTLIQENTWEDLNMAMGVTPEEDRLFMKWYEEGIVSYEEGQKLLERIYKERGKAKRKDMEAAVTKHTYREGAEEIVKYLKDKGYKVALISGSIDLAVSQVAGELGVETWEAHNKIVFDEGGVFVRIECEGDDADFKLKALKRFALEMGVGVDEVMCVGDGYNDRKMFSECGRGVTFKGSEVESYAWDKKGRVADA
jgi:phosphoserine phosphatase